jgi:hypothetical protein
MIIPKQPFAFHSTRGTGPSQATVGPYAHPMCRTYVCSATTWPYSCPLCGTYSRTSVRVENQITSGGRYVHSSGRLVTRLTAYHISRHVASTFKRLATATTQCDLINFYQHRRGNLSSYDTAHEITRLLPVLLAEHLCDTDSGTIHRFLVFMHLGFHFNS